MTVFYCRFIVCAPAVAVVHYFVLANVCAENCLLNDYTMIAYITNIYVMIEVIKLTENEMMIMILLPTHKSCQSLFVDQTI